MRPSHFAGLERIAAVIKPSIAAGFFVRANLEDAARFVLGRPGAGEHCDTHALERLLQHFIVS